MSRMTNGTNDLLRRLREDPVGALSGQSRNIESEQVSSRPIFRVRCTESGVTLGIKLSRLPEMALKNQLRCVSLMKNAVDFIPKCFGYCSDGHGMHYEIWEWLEETKVRASATAEEKFGILNAFFAQFVAVSGKIEFPIGEIFPNSFGAIAKRMFRESTINDMTSGNEFPKEVRKIASIAKGVWGQETFLNGLETLPKAYVHTDIRSDNVISDHLMDYSNSRVDVRLIELVRFGIINFEHTPRVARLIDSPSIVFCKTHLPFTAKESEMLTDIASIDFLCVYCWAHQQILEDGSRSSWAKEFIGNGAMHFQKCFLSRR